MPVVFADWLVLFAAIRSASSFFHLLSRGQILIFEKDDSVQLDCAFYTERFDLFENPFLWRKTQLEEVTQMNMMGNMLEPFASSSSSSSSSSAGKRFRVLFLSEPPRYIFRLSIRNVSDVDSGNYTCEVNGPHNVLLGILTHTVFVRVPVSSIRLWNEDTNASAGSEGPNSTSPGPSPWTGTPDGPQTGAPQLRLTVNRPSRVYCAAVTSLPEARLAVYVELDDVTPRFRFVNSTRVTSQPKGLRVVEHVTVGFADDFLPEATHDGKRMRCVAMVTGLPPKTAEAKIVVNYGPVISCYSSEAIIGERNVFVGCKVKARPWITSLYWTIDVNGTTVRSGQVVSEYWTLVTDRNDGVIETQLYMKRVTEGNFRSYELTAENSVAASSGRASLVRKFRTFSSTVMADQAKRKGFSHRVPKDPRPETTEAVVQRQQRYNDITTNRSSRPSGMTGIFILLLLLSVTLLPFVRHSSVRLT